MTLQELLAAKKPNKPVCDIDSFKTVDDSDGKVVMYKTDPLALVPEGKLIHLNKMIVKIADFGLGFPLMH